MIQNHKEDYEHPLFPVRFYFRHVMAAGVGLIRREMRQGDLVLDFGCGRQFLKRCLPERTITIVGYDIVPSLSQVEDYRDLSPDIIYCNHVLEHLSLDDLRETLAVFAAMDPRCIVTGIPTENFISRVCAAIGRPHGYFEHQTRMAAIHQELEKNFMLVERRNILTLTMMSLWKKRR